MSFHFTQICAFIAYSFRFYGLLFVFYWGKYTKKMELARREWEIFFIKTLAEWKIVCIFVVEKL